MVVALVAGFLTGGFGLLRRGGAATPAEEADAVATKAVRAFNSFSLKDLLNNPYAAMGDLSDEVAPSESRLNSHLTTVDTSDLLALTKNSIDLAADAIGSFSIKADGLKTTVTEITDEVAVVTFTEGEVVVAADVARLQEVLKKLPSVGAEQLKATLSKYGLAPTKPVEFTPEEGWSDELMAGIKSTFPFRLKLTECAKPNPDTDPLEQISRAGLCDTLSRLVVVKENGRWYLSPLLSWSGGIADSTGRIRYDKLAAPERKDLLKVAAARHGSPVDAPSGLLKALLSGDERAALAELPLAERRYVAASGLLSTSSLTGFESSGRFSEIVRKGDQAKLRIDQLSVTSPMGAIEITDGTCVHVEATTQCLSDLKKLVAGDDAFLFLEAQDWTAFEEQTGISGERVMSKLKTAARAAVDAIDPNQVGVVAVQEDGSWQFSGTATLDELSRQLAAALRTGLISIQE